MQDLADLVAGYRAFMRDAYPRRAPLYRALATRGQKPQIMVITSADSRLDPEALFDADPGQLYILRNVAGLVPPHEPLGFHGTSATIEFAVKEIGISHIVVLGHSQCSSIKRFIESTLEPKAPTDYIDHWLSLLGGFRGEIMNRVKTGGAKHLQRSIEEQAVGLSLDNLRSFPFVRERVGAGQLNLHGAYFDLTTGMLLSLNPDTGIFDPVVSDLPVGDSLKSSAVVE